MPSMQISRSFVFPGGSYHLDPLSATVFSFSPPPYPYAQPLVQHWYANPQWPLPLPTQPQSLYSVQSCTPHYNPHHLLQQPLSTAHSCPNMGQQPLSMHSVTPVDVQNWSSSILPLQTFNSLGLGERSISTPSVNVPDWSPGLYSTSLPLQTFNNLTQSMITMSALSLAPDSSATFLPVVTTSQHSSPTSTFSAQVLDVSLIQENDVLDMVDFSPSPVDFSPSPSVPLHVITEALFSPPMASSPDVERAMHTWWNIGDEINVY